jgi:nucleosome binding factor SPN SPT16 subunit
MSFEASTYEQSWLFGYEFPGMTMLLTPEKIYFATSAAKGISCF